MACTPPRCPHPISDLTTPTSPASTPLFLLLQVALLPLLAGAALSSAVPQLAAAPLPLRSALALALLAPVCGGVVARSAQEALSASPLRLLGAVVAAQAGERASKRAIEQLGCAEHGAPWVWSAVLCCVWEWSGGGRGVECPMAVNLACYMPSIMPLLLGGPQHHHRRIPPHPAL